MTELDGKVTIRLQELTQSGEEVKRTVYDPRGVDPFYVAAHQFTELYGHNRALTTLAEIRNRAAHGEWDEFSKTDVEEMLQSVRLFMETHFA